LVEAEIYTVFHKKRPKSQLVLSVATLLQCWKIWFIHDKLLKFYSCSHKKRAKRWHLRVCGDSWTFTRSSKTVH